MGLDRLAYANEKGGAYVIKRIIESVGRQVIPSLSGNLSCFFQCTISPFNSVRYNGPPVDIIQTHSVIPS